MIGCQRGRLARACWELMMRHPRGAAVEWAADHGGEYWSASKRKFSRRQAVATRQRAGEWDEVHTGTV